MKVTVIQNNKKEVITCAGGTRLFELLGDRLNNSCGGKGTCGKCKVKIDENIVLACEVIVNRDMKVVLPDKSEYKILTDGIKRNVTPDGENGLGIAIDIGTTTIAACLINLSNGEILKTLSELNSQKTYGSDVITRIEKGSDLMNACIVKQLNSLIKKLSMGENIKKILIAGNTVMLHFAQGFDAGSIAVAPFVPVSTSLNEYKAWELGLNGDFGVITAPCISGYVGGDTVCAVLACSMDGISDVSLLIDIGTNGEMVLNNKGRLICCSAAAGPAFEGAHIKHGTGSVEGAISRVRIKNGIDTETIGNKPPIGICGSGIVDAAAEMLKYDIIDKSGHLDFDFRLVDDIFITQSDIREVQLAKSAIFSGIETLVSSCGLNYSDIQKVYLAGGMGSYIDIESAVNIGLLPKQLADKIVISGNASLSGAVSMLLSGKLRDDAKKIASKTDYLELSSSKRFQDAFISNLLF